MYEGTAYSINTFFAELAKRTGLCNIWDVASRAGVTLANNGASPLDDPSYQVTPGVIGGSFGMSPLTLAEAYATFAARGLHCEPRVITSIRTLDKEELEVPKPDCQQVIKPEVADAVNDVMVNVVGGDQVSDGFGANMYLGRPTAGKTGTTNDVQAVWFAGYTPNLAAAVWAGSPVAPRKYPMTNVAINGIYPAGGQWAGSTLPGPIWHDAMLGAVADLPVENFVPLDPELIDGAQAALPSLGGLTPEKAAQALDKLGLHTEIADYEVDSYEPKGTVAYTSPGAGTSVKPGDTITLYLSNGVAPPSEDTTGGRSGAGNAGDNGGDGGGGQSNAGGNGGGGGDGGGGNGGGNNGRGGNGPGNSDGTPGGGNTNH
ncbi:MAG: PASTA domain-containing protein, partial [Actinomycetes bacterium]